LTLPACEGGWGGSKWTGRPRSAPSQLVTCIISGALVEGGPNAIAAFRRILEHSASQILPNGGMVSGPSGPLMIQGPPLPTLPRKRGGVGRGFGCHRLQSWHRPNATSWRVRPVTLRLFSHDRWFGYVAGRYGRTDQQPGRRRRNGWRLSTNGHSLEPATTK